MTPLSLSRLVLLFFRVGNSTFGGGDPTMAALQSELVASRRWLSPEKYGLAYALARITPGTNLLAFCAGAAWQLLGWPGAVLAVLAVTLPSALVVLLLTAGYEAWKTNALAMAAIAGTLAAAVGMMAAAAWQLVRAYLKPGSKWKRALRAVIIVGASVALSLGLGMSPIQLLALAAAVGAFWRDPVSA